MFAIIDTETFEKEFKLEIIEVVEPTQSAQQNNSEYVWPDDLEDDEYA